jgi:adenine phosphoribosyltransferase
MRSVDAVRAGRTHGSDSVALRRKGVRQSAVMSALTATIREKIRDIPDFPKPGILFKDITPLLADPKAFTMVLDAFHEAYVGKHVDAIVGIESRGFIFGGALAARLSASFVPVRKPGKLPYHVDKTSYALEYGEGTLEMHKDSIRRDSNVLIVDDLLATGGTAAGAATLVRGQGGKVIGYAFVIELGFLNGREKLAPTEITSLVHF